MIGDPVGVPGTIGECVGLLDGWNVGLIVGGNEGGRLGKRVGLNDGP
jgi:hypothetical protein